jgi:hypothetical protein
MQNECSGFLIFYSFAIPLLKKEMKMKFPELDPLRILLTQITQ